MDKGRKTPVPRLDLICRKLYDEACPLTYSEPTFQFNNKLMLSCWLSGVKSTHKWRVRRLRVCNRVMPEGFDLEKLDSSKDAIWTWPTLGSSSIEKIVGLMPRAHLERGHSLCDQAGHCVYRKSRLFGLCR